jgi:hypothetical protein
LIVGFCTHLKKTHFPPFHKLFKGTIVIPTFLLARELALPSLLPAAFWSASTHREFLAHPCAHALSDADRHIILSTTKPLRAAHADHLFGWLDEDVVVSPECSTPDVCRAQKLKNALSLRKPPGLSLRLRWRPGAVQGLCAPCVAVGKKLHEEGTRRPWGGAVSSLRATCVGGDGGGFKEGRGFV